MRSYVMKKKLKEIFIPAGEARAFTIDKGQILRLLNPEGEQVADAIFFNAHDYKETFHPGFSCRWNQFQGIGNAKRLAKLYSKPPRYNVMFSVIDDPVGVHWAYLGSRCNRLNYKLRDNVDAPPHRSCQDNLAEAIAPYGLTADDVPDVYNIWMNVDIDPETQFFVVKPPLVKKGDHIDMLAEMDCLVAISACPSDKIATNMYKIKPLIVEIYSP
jgi:hypothetical protein